MKPLTPSFSRLNSFSKPNGRDRQKNRTNSELTVAYWRGYGKFLKRSARDWRSVKSPIVLCRSM